MKNPPGECTPRGISTSIKTFSTFFLKALDIYRYMWYNGTRDKGSAPYKAQKEKPKMMKHEFEQIAGYEVSFEDYNNIIEPMYMAVNLSKGEFVKTINRKAFDLNEKKKAMINEMKAIAEERKENAEHFTNYEAEEKLQELAHRYAEIFHRFSTPEIARKQTYQTWGCSYPSDVIFYGGVVNGHYYEIERIKLVD